MGTLKNPENHLPNLHVWGSSRLIVPGCFLISTGGKKMVEIQEAGYVPLESFFKVDFGSTPRAPGLQMKV